jgi:hypothetical protein
MPCDPRCWFTAMLGPTGERLMMAAPGSSKFPARTLHPMCPDCKKEMLEEMNLALLFNNDRTLIERWKKLKGVV